MKLVVTTLSHIIKSVIALGLFMVITQGLYAAKQKPFVQKGVLDLRGHDFKENPKIELNGLWEFYWNQLIIPEDFSSLNATPSYFPVPKVWENDTLQISSTGFGTYRVRIFLDSVTPELAINIPQLYNAYTLYVNQEYVVSNGEVGKNLETSTPQWQVSTKDLVVTRDTLDLVLQVSNFRHKRGGISNPITLGSSYYLQSQRKKIEVFDYIMASSLFFIGLFFLVVFWFGRQEKQVLFYSLFSLLFSYRIVGSSSYTLHSLFPELPWILTYRLELITLYLSAGFFALYSYHLYKRETSKRLTQLFMLLSGIYSVITVVFPPLYFSQLISSYIIILIFGLIYLFGTYFFAYSNNRMSSLISLISSSVLFIMMIHGMIVYFGYLPVNKSLYFFGYLQFFFFQSIILFYRYTQKLENARKNAEVAAQSRSDFLSMISHEIRTPLNAVIGLTNYLISDKPRKNQEEELRTLKFSAENLHVLINDVLDYSKLDAGKIEFELRDVNINEIAHNIVKGFEPKAKEQGIYIKYNYDNAIPRFISADGLRVSQLLTNLIGNAIKFTKKGGVTLNLEKITVNKKKVAIKFLIEDTGIGIPKDKQGTIFESFSQASTSTTREYGGTGLGLSITKKILDLQNTQIHLFSRVGQGSRFYFTQTFDICERQETVGESIGDAQVELAGKRILLVEDNPINVMVAKKFLSRWDIEVDVAENGREALEKNVYSSYDLILMDLQMPVMDGYTASKELRVLGLKIPIIALTASVMLDVGDKVYSSGMNDYITKPFNPDELYKKIRAHIEAVPSKTKG